MANIQPNSDKSGAAMRAWPIGVLGDIESVVSHAKIQAAVTHNTKSGIDAAVASALMTHYFVYCLGPKKRLPHWLDSQVDGHWLKPYVGKVGSKGWMSVSAAITAVAGNHTLSGLLMDCLNFGGDVDTVATIAMAAASCCSEYEDDIPRGLVDELENGPYGRDYLKKVDVDLLALVESPQ